MSTTVCGRRPRGWLAVGGILAGMGVILVAVAGLGVAQDQAPATRPARTPAPRPEYARVAEEPGLVSREPVEGRTRSVFRAQDGRWTAVLLENQILAALEDRAGVLEGKVLVAATGVVSEYRGRNYLLLTSAQLRPLPGGD